jgi:NADH pyrophosphatase NudC (nudix superfamily)
MFDKSDPQWQMVMDEMLSGLTEWRQQHPKATFRDIEQETMRRISSLQARLMSDLAQTSEATTWTAETTAVCPECGAEMRPDGQRTRHLQGLGGADIPLQRSYVVCVACGAGFFPPG